MREPYPCSPLRSDLGRRIDVIPCLFPLSARIRRLSRLTLGSSTPSSLHSFSEMTPEGKRVTKLEQILLNGSQIALLVPGGKPGEDE